MQVSDGWGVGACWCAPRPLAWAGVFLGGAAGHACDEAGGGGVGGPGDTERCHLQCGSFFLPSLACIALGSAGE